MGPSITLDQLVVIINAQTADFKKQIAEVNDQLEGISRQAKQAADPVRKFGGELMKIGKGMAIGAIAAGIALIAKNVGGAVRRFDTLNNAPKVLRNLGYAAEDSEKAIDTLSDGLDGLPTKLDDAANALVGIASASGRGIKEATDLTLAFNNMALAGGKGPAEAQRALVQFTQAIGRGKMGMQEFNTLSEVMPAQLSQVAKSLLGPTANATTLKDAFSDGTITMDQFMDEIVRLDKEGGEGFASFSDQAKDATAGIATAWSNLNTRIQYGITEIIKAMGGTAITDKINAIGNALKAALVWIAGWIEDNPKLASTIATVAGVSAGLLTALGAIGLVVPKVIAGFKLLAAVFSLSPFGRIVTIITLLAGALLGTGVALKDVDFSNFIKSIQTIVDSVTTFIKDKMPTLIKAGIEIITNLIQGIVQALPQIINAAVQIITTLITSLAQLVPLLLDAGLQILQGIIDAIVENIDLIIQAAVTILTTLVNSIIEILPILIDAGIQILQAIINAISENIGKIIDAAVQIITTLVDAIVENLPMVIDMTVELIDTLVEAITDNLPKIIDAAMDILLTVIETLLDNLDKIVDATIELVEAIQDAMIDNMPKIIEGALRIILAIYSEMLKPANLKKLASAAIRLIVGIAGALIGAIPEIVKAGWKLIVGLAGAVWDKRNDVWDKIKEIGRKIIDKVKGVDLVEAGKSLIRGLIDGMGRMIGAVKDKAGEIVQSVRDFFPFSPAKEGPFSGRGYTTYSGVALMQDFADSIKKQAPYLKKTMNAAMPEFSIPSPAQLSSRLDLDVSGRAVLGDIDGRQTPVNVQIDGQTLLSFVIDGTNGRSFMTNQSSIIV